MSEAITKHLFFNTHGVLYHCVREGSQDFEAVVVPKKHYQLVVTNPMM